MTWKIEPWTVTDNFHPTRVEATQDPHYVLVEGVDADLQNRRKRVYGPTGAVYEQLHSEALSVANGTLIEGKSRARNLSNGELIPMPPGWAFGINGVWLANGADVAGVQMSGNSYGVHASPDGSCFAVVRHRHEVDVVFGTQPVEELKALPKKARALAMSNRFVAVAGAKVGEWYLLDRTSWKKLGAQQFSDRAQLAAFSPSGSFVAVSVVSDTPTKTSLYIIDVGSGAVVSSHAVDGRMSFAWRNEHSLVSVVTTWLGTHDSFPVTSTLTPLLPAPTSAPVVAVAKKTKVKPSRSQAIGLPFELTWLCSEAELSGVLKKGRSDRADRNTPIAEAILVDPTFSGAFTIEGNQVASLAAALLLRAPLVRSNLSKVLSEHLGHPHVRAVESLLDASGKGRLAFAKHLANQALSDDEKVALVNAVVMSPWLAGLHELPGESLPAAIRTYCAQFGNESIYRAALAAQWEQGKATHLDGHEHRCINDWPALLQEIANNPNMLRAALAHRHFSGAGAHDTPAQVAPLLAEVGGHLTERASGIVAYATLVHARTGQPAPSSSRLLWTTLDLTTPLEAAALAVLFANAPLNGVESLAVAWIMASKQQWRELPSLLPAAMAGRAQSRFALGRLLVERVPADHAEAVGTAMMGTKSAVDRSAHALLLRARDEAGVPESAAWFAKPNLWQPEMLLQKLSGRVRGEVVNGWINGNQNLASAGKCQDELGTGFPYFDAAVRVAVVEANFDALGQLCIHDNSAAWLPILKAHAKDSKNIDAVFDRLRYAAPENQLADARSAVAATTHQQTLMRVLSTMPAATAPLTTFFFEGRHWNDEGDAAMTRIVRIPDLDGKRHLITIHLDDVPELKRQHPNAASLSIFGKPGKNPGHVPITIVENAVDSAAHVAVLAATQTLRRLTVALPDGALGSARATPNMTLTRALPYWHAAVFPHYPSQPNVLCAMQDSVIADLEDDEGPFIVYARGPGKYLHRAG